MGITFRSGGYIRYVRLGGRTIKDGEAAAIWRSDGTHEQIIGPRRVRLFFSTIRFLTRYKAESSQYIIVSHRDGTVQHIPGPASNYENPTLHDNVCVREATVLKSELDIIVVQSDGSQAQNDMDNLKGPKPSQEIKKGPLLFIPKPNERKATFSWSQVQGSSICPGGDNFNVLNLSTKSFMPLVSISLEGSYFLQTEFRIDFDIESVETVIKMNDPIELMYHAFLTDVHSLAPSISLQLVREGKQNYIACILNSLSDYCQLQMSAKRCGMVVQSVRVTNMSPCEALLKSIHENRDTERKFKYEMAEQDQKTALEKKEIENEAELKTLKEQLDKQVHDIKVEAMKRAMAFKLEETKLSNEITRMRDKTAISFLKELKSLDVDITKYLSTKGNTNCVRNTRELIDSLADDWKNLEMQIK